MHIRVVQYDMHNTRQQVSRVRTVKYSGDAVDHRYAPAGVHTLPNEHQHQHFKQQQALIRALNEIVVVDGLSFLLSFFSSTKPSTSGSACRHHVVSSTVT